MHNKQLIADNRTAILGGRNIGDEYMGLHEDFNFHDLDVLGVGPVARQASAVFDRYWNSDWVRRLPPPPPGADASRLTPAMLELPPAAAAHPGLRAIAAGQRDWTADMLALVHTLIPGRSTVHADPPSRAEGSANRMPAAFRAVMLLGAARGADQQCLRDPRCHFHGRPAHPGGARRAGAHPDQFTLVQRCAGRECPLRALAPAPAGDRRHAA
jgi:phosphatidylserine/phosphatidylglycerophosphate/cardiolipin synthase-like enzyme